MSQKTDNKGFTLIELVIVLAIAALILVGILLAVSGAQRSRRDQQRKSDVARVLANVQTYESNHGGVLPTSPLSNPIFTKLTSGMTDPETGTIYKNHSGSGPKPAVSARIDYTVGAVGVVACDQTSSLPATAVMLTISLESGDTACVDDH